METKKVSVKNSQIDRTRFEYGAFGYILSHEIPISDKKISLHFMRNIYKPIWKSLRILEKRYYRAHFLSKFHLFFIFLLLALLFGVAGTLFFFLMNLLPMAPEVLFHPAFYIVSWIVSGLCLLISIIMIFVHISYRRDLKVIVRNVCEDGYEILRKRKRIPKDMFIKKDVMHYHYIHDYYQAN